jgi:hypothetical protein
MVLAAGSVPAWSQSAPAPAAAPEAPATTQPQPAQGWEERDGRPGFRGGGERRSEGRFPGGDGMRPPPRMEWRRGGGGGGYGGSDDPRSDEFIEPTPEEWNEIEAFMKKHSPERLARLEEIGDEERQQNVKNMFAARYRAMQKLKEQDPELYEIRVARMPVEDKVFELGWRLTHKQSEKPDETRSQLRAQLRLLVKSRLDERALSLRHMERRLKADQQRIDDMVEANLRDIAEDNIPRDLRPPQFGGGPRRERRGGGGGGGEDDPNNATASPAGEP